MDKLIEWNKLDNLKVQIKDSQDYLKSMIKEIGDKILSNDKIKLIFVSGPSASGKTTFSLMLEKYLNKNNRGSKTLSMDDFFYDRDKIRILPDGMKDFDSIDALDVITLNNCFEEILECGKTQIPRFDFFTGKRKIKTELFTLNNNEIVIIEGIHAFNTLIQEKLPKGVNINIFIEPQTDIKFEDGYTINHKEVRLLRRMIRDLYTRGHSIKDTLNQWHHVRDAEEKNLYPYVGNAHYVVDSFASYELRVYRATLYKLFEEHLEDSRFMRLRKGLDYVEPLSPSAVPKDALITEFTKFDD